MSIGNFENLCSNAVRRALRLHERLAVPRISDLAFLSASTGGRIEIEALDEGKEDQVVQRIQNAAVAAVFSRHFAPGQFEHLLATFAEGAAVEVGEGLPADSYLQAVGDSEEMNDARRKLQLTDRPEAIASLCEFVLEGLHLTKRLNKTEAEGGAIYQR